MTVVTTAPQPSPGVAAVRYGRLGVPLLVIAAAVVVGLVAPHDIPGSFDIGFQDAIHRMYDWITANRTSHWLFNGVFDPISTAIDGAVDGVRWVLEQLGWVGVLALAALTGLSTGGWRAALYGTLSLEIGRAHV